MADKKMDIDIEVNADAQPALNVEQALDRLNKQNAEQAQAQAAQVEQLSAVTKHTDAAATEYNRLTQNVQGANAAISGASQVLQGNVQGLAQMSMGLSRVSQNLKNVGAAAGAFAAGWQIGKMLDDLIGVTAAIDKLTDEMFRLGEQTNVTVDAVKELSKASLDDLAQQLSQMRDHAAGVASALSETAADRESRETGEFRIRRARIRAQTNPGLEQDRALADLQFEESAAAAERKRDAASDQIAMADQEGAKLRSVLEETTAKYNALKAEHDALLRVQATTGDEESGRKAENLVPEIVAAERARNAARANIEAEMPKIEKQRNAARRSVREADVDTTVGDLEHASALSNLQAKIDTEAAAAEAAAQKEEIARLKAEIAAAKNVGGGQLQADVEREGGEAAAAQAAVDQFRSTSPYSQRSFSFRQRIAELEREAAAQAAEYEAAVAALADNQAANTQRLRDLTSRLNNLLGRENSEL